MANEFEDGFTFGEEARGGSPKKTTPIESGNTASASSSMNNAVNRKGRQAQPMSKKSNALPDPNKVTKPPVQRNRNAQQGTNNYEPDPMFVNNQTQQQGTPVQQQVQAKGNKKPKKQKQQKVKDNNKKRSKLPIVLTVVGVLAVAGGGGFFAYKMLMPVPMEQDYNTSGRKVYDTLASTINNYDAKTLDELIGSEKGDSYLAQEWSYANNNQVREDFIKKVCSMIKFSYPQEQQMSTKGKPMTDKSGNPIMVESYMNNGEKVIITLPDYSEIGKIMKNDKELSLIHI